MMAITITVDTAKLDQIIAALPKEKVVRFVADGVEYGLYQEMGFTHYKSGKPVAAHPFMSPAVEAVRPSFEKSFSGIDSLTMVETLVDKAAFDIEAGAKIRAPWETRALINSIHVQPDRP